MQHKVTKEEKSYFFFFCKIPFYKREGEREGQEKGFQCFWERVPREVLCLRGAGWGRGGGGGHQLLFFIALAAAFLRCLCSALLLLSAALLRCFFLFLFPFPFFPPHMHSVSFLLDWGWGSVF